MAKLAIKEATRQLEIVMQKIKKNLSAADRLAIIRIALLLEREAKLNLAKTRGQNVRYNFNRPSNNELMNSITHVIQSTPNGIRAMIGSRVKYARMQELGTQGKPIKPRKAKKLFIPLTEETYTESQRGSKITIEPSWKHGEDFVLANRVFRKPKPYLAPALNNNINRIIDIYIDEIVRGL